MAETGGTQVGAAYVALEARTAQLELGLATATAKIEEFAGKAEAQTAKASGGFNTLGKNIRKTIAPITQLVGAVGAAVGTFTVFLSLGKQIGQALTGIDENGKNAADRLKEFKEQSRSSVQSLTGARFRGPFQSQLESESKQSNEIIAKANKEIDRLEARIEGRRSILGIGGRTPRIGSEPNTPEGREQVRKEIAYLESLKAEQDRIRTAELRAQSFRAGELQRAADRQRTVGAFSLSGDPAEAVRLLRSIEMQNRRRRIDE